MNLGQALKMAIRSISAGKLRSFLTMLGVIIGLASVMIMVSYAKGQNMAIQQYYKSLGSNRITVSASTNNPSFESIYTVLRRYCAKEHKNIVGFTPDETLYGLNVRYGIKTLISDNYETYPTIYLGNEQFSTCRNYTLSKGRDISLLDIDGFHKVCVLGAATARELFGYSDPIGQDIRLNGHPFTVIGIYQAKAGKVAGKKEDTEGIKSAMEAQDRLILLPHTMNRILNNNQAVSQFTVKARDADVLPRVISGLTSFLQEYTNRYGGWSNVWNDSGFIQQDNKANEMQQRFLGGIAAISLLVGGIGIMNIMLVTVKERTREIGIRKAIGAERKSIIAQFLIEAAVLCGVGGILGIAVGYLGTLILGKVTFNTILLPDAGITIAAFAVSLLMGLIFGMYPAAKASGLPPVDALRAD